MIKANITKLKEIPKACADCPYFSMDNFTGSPVCKISNMVINTYRINISDDKDSNCPLYEEKEKNTMEVKCTIDDYSDGKYNYNAVEVSSVFADGDKVKISFKDTSITVSTEELISAVTRCKLNYKGV